MKLRQCTLGLLLAALCLLSACGGGNTPARTAAQSAPATKAAPPAQSVEETATSAEPAKPTGKPLFTGDFAAQADKVNALEEDADSAIQEMQVGLATITLGRFHTNHAAESYLDEYGGGAFEINEEIVLSEDLEGTHYRWHSGSNEDSTVLDAVVAEASGYSILFLCRDPLDAFEGTSELGPDRAAVDGWVKSLTLTYQ